MTELMMTEILSIVPPVYQQLCRFVSPTLTCCVQEVVRRGGTTLFQVKKIATTTTPVRNTNTGSRYSTMLSTTLHHTPPHEDVFKKNKNDEDDNHMIVIDEGDQTHLLHSEFSIDSKHIPNVQKLTRGSLYDLAPSKYEFRREYSLVTFAHDIVLCVDCVAARFIPNPYLTAIPTTTATSYYTSNHPPLALQGPNELFTLCARVLLLHNTDAVVTIQDDALDHLTYTEYIGRYDDEAVQWVVSEPRYLVHPAEQMAVMLTDGPRTFGALFPNVTTVGSNFLAYAGIAGTINLEDIFGRSGNLASIGAGFMQSMLYVRRVRVGCALRGITAIPDYLFQDCELLEHIDFEGTMFNRPVLTIGKSFCNNTKFECFVFPQCLATVTHIGINFLMNCKKLKWVDMTVVADSLQEIDCRFLKQTVALERLIIRAQTTMNDSSSSLSSPTRDVDGASPPPTTDGFPSSLTSLRTLGGGALYGCTSLQCPFNPTAATLLSNIGYESFANTGFSSFVLDGRTDDMTSSSPLQTIGSDVLADSSLLKTITVQSLPVLSTFGSQFARLCRNLTTVVLNDLPALIKLGSGFLEKCSSLREVDMRGINCSPNFKHIPDKFLAGCSSLERIIGLEELLMNITSIGTLFLSDCRSLRGPLDLSVCVPNLTSIGDYFMSDCQSLEEIIFAPTTTTSHKYPLPSDNCTTNTNGTVLLPLASIPDYFLYNCRSLRTINQTSPPSRGHSSSALSSPQSSKPPPMFGYPLPITASIGCMFMGNCHAVEEVNLTGVVRIGMHNNHEVLCTNIDDGFMSGCKCLRRVVISPTPSLTTSHDEGLVPQPHYPMPEYSFAHSIHLINAFGTRPLPTTQHNNDRQGDTPSSTHSIHLVAVNNQNDDVVLPRALATSLHEEYLHTLTSKRIHDE